MIIVHDIKTVFIVPPRTGSTALFSAINAKYELVERPYRHMEAKGIPEELISYKVICVHRDKLERLFSTYKYMAFSSEDKKGWWEIARQDTNRSFEEWLLNSMHPFCLDFDETGFNSLLYPLPITRKPSWVWAMTRWGNLAEQMKLADIADRFELDIKVSNTSVTGIEMPVTAGIYRHVKKYL